MKECCKDERNLGPAAQFGPNPDTTVRVCAVCHCRHFETIVEPGELGVVGTG